MKQHIKHKRWLAYKAGIFSEYLVACFMACKGYTPLRHRYKNDCGEIDLIFFKKRIVVFVEVKARRGAVDYFGLIGMHQQKRIMRAAQIFMAKFDPQSKYMARFDLCIVRPVLWPAIQHVQNIWC